MSGKAEMSFSGTSTVASVCLGAAEAPRGTGARATGEEDEVVLCGDLAMGISRLATISGPAAQEEARVRALRRAQLLAAYLLEFNSRSQPMNNMSPKLLS